MNTALLLLPDFSLILLGAGIRRWMHLGDHFWAGVEKLVYFILFPAMLINAVAKTHINLAEALPLLATSFSAMAAGMLLGLLVFVIGKPWLEGRGESANPQALKARKAGLPLDTVKPMITVA